MYTFSNDKFPKSDLRTCGSAGGQDQCDGRSTLLLNKLQRAPFEV